MAIMSLRSRSHVKASVVLTRADNLFIHHYIRSLRVGQGSNPCPTACVSDALATEPHRQISMVYIYIYMCVCECISNVYSLYNLIFVMHTLHNDVLYLVNLTSIV